MIHNRQKMEKLCNKIIINVYASGCIRYQRLNLMFFQKKFFAASPYENLIFSKNLDFITWDNLRLAFFLNIISPLCDPSTQFMPHICVECICSQLLSSLFPLKKYIDYLSKIQRIFFSGFRTQNLISFWDETDFFFKWTGFNGRKWSIKCFVRQILCRT